MSLFVVCGGYVLRAQLMRDVFGSMPDSVFVLLTRVNRLDCIDFIENGVEARVRNRFDEYSVLRVLTDDYLDLQLTDVCCVEMKLLPVEGGKIICMGRTYSGPARETSLAFYSLDWEPLGVSDRVEWPDYGRYWVDVDSVGADEVARLQHLQDMRFVVARLGVDDLSLTFELQPGEVEREEVARIGSFVRPVVAVWDGGRFVFVE